MPPTHPPSRHAARWASRAGVPVAAVVAVAAVMALLLVAPGEVRAADPTASPSSTPTPTPQPSRPLVPVATLPPIATPSPTPTPAPGVTQLGTNVTFYGRGYGHGVGMSQYGAKGRALAGQTTDEILAHYYQGATPGTIALGTAIRVRVLKAFTATSATPLVLYGLGGDWTIDGVTTVFPKSAKVTVTPTTASGSTTWKVKVTSSGGTVLRNAATTGFRMRPASAATLLQVYSKPSKYDSYRGVIRVRLDTTGPTLNVINELPLETYLRGVVPAEMPSTWPVAALRAQAIAARSYAARRLRPGESYYDVSDDTSSQVYHGQEAEHASTDGAITATAGVVRKSGSSIANTLFHSAGGGATEHNENVFVSSTGAKVAGPVSYLRGSADRRSDGTAYDDTSPYATWTTKTYTRTQLSSWFADDGRTDVGNLSALDLRDRGVSGRLISVKLIGSAGTKTVSGDVFRSVFNAHRPSGDPMMRSTLVDTRFVP
jgi:SpoIID/LytB domain protein